MSTPDLPRANDLPAWMGKLRDRYLQTETSQFILHGNVHDFVLCGNEVWHMTDFLDAFFAPSGKLVVHFDPGRGLWLPNEKDAVKAARVFVRTGFLSLKKLAPSGLDKTPAKMIARNLEDELGGLAEPALALQAIEVLLTDPATAVAAVIHYAELIAPDGSPSSLSFLDRTAAARLHRWSLSDDIGNGDNLVIMLTGAMPDLSRRLTRNPRVGAMNVPLPDSITRARFLAKVKSGLDPDRGENLTRVTAGLQLRQIQDIVAPQRPAAQAESVEGEDARSMFKGTGDLPFEEIATRKKEILEQECFGLIEVIQPDHDFEAVGGMDPIKEVLNKVAGHVREGRSRQVPMGILFVGPMGTGKSFLGEAFANESGLAAVRLKNFRDKWVGSTEANLEKVLNVIEGLGEILVMIDEGDRSIGGAGDSDGGVNSRVMARLKEFMSDHTHRGRIIFVMMTNRPDKLDTDMKRPGRFDLKIPFFPPQAADERLAILRALIRRHKVDCDLPDEEILPILEGLAGYAAADLEAVVLLAYDDFESNELPEGMTTRPEKVTAAFFERAVRDFMPTRETAMIEYMQLLAVHEASNRRLLPPSFRGIEVSELNRRLADARDTLERQKLFG